MVILIGVGSGVCVGAVVVGMGGGGMLSGRIYREHSSHA